MKSMIIIIKNIYNLKTTFYKKKKKNLVRVKNQSFEDLNYRIIFYICLFLSNYAFNNFHVIINNIFL